MEYKNAKTLDVFFTQAQLTSTTGEPIGKRIKLQGLRPRFVSARVIVEAHAYHHLHSVTCDFLANDEHLVVFPISDPVNHSSQFKAVNADKLQSGQVSFNFYTYLAAAKSNGMTATGGTDGDQMLCLSLTFVE